MVRTIILPKLRKPHTVFVGEQSYMAKVGNTVAERFVTVYIDLTRKEWEKIKDKDSEYQWIGAIVRRPNEQYVLCTLWDDTRCKYYEYHIPLSVFLEYKDKQHLLFDEYVSRYNVKSYGRGKRSV